MNKYAKLWAPIIGGILMAILSAYANFDDDEGITSSEWIQIAIQGLSVFIVWATSNLPEWPKMKVLVMAIMAVLNLLVTTVIGGLSTSEILNLAIAFLSALGVYIIPNKTNQDPLVS